MAVPWFAIAAACIAVGVVLLRRSRRRDVEEEPEPDEPFDLFKEGPD